MRSDPERSQPGAAGLRSVVLVLTTRCNLACSYCYQERRGARSMAGEVVDASVDLALRSPHPTPRLGLTGGEPLLEPALVRRAVERLAQRGPPAGKTVRLTVATNGTLLDDGTAALLAKHRAHLRLSFDGVDAAQEARAPGTFPLLERTLARLRADHSRLFAEHLEVVVTVTSANLPHLAESTRLLLRLGVRRIELGAITTPDPGWNGSASAELERQLAAVFDLCLEHERDTGARPVRFLDRPAGAPADEGSGPPLCALGSGDGVVVDVDGQVVPCVMLAGSTVRLPQLLAAWVEPFRLGDVRDPDLDVRLAALPEVAAQSPLLRDRHRRVGACGPCAECRFVSACLPCPISACLGPGRADPLRAARPQCDLTRLTLALRERFPPRPSPADILSGRAPLPRQMEELWAAMRGNSKPP